MTTHELKVWPDFFDDIRSGKKPFDARLDDRNFREGDIIVFCEYMPENRSTAVKSTGEYTGAKCIKRISYILRGEKFGIMPRHCVMGLLPE